MIDASRRSSGYPISPRATSNTQGARTPEGPQNDAVTDAINGALQSQSNNPILRALMGESGFDGVQGVGGASRVGAQAVNGGSQAGPQGVNRPGELDGPSAQRGFERDPLIEYLKGMIATLRTALRKDYMPPSYKALPEAMEMPTAGSAPATANGANAPPPPATEEGPRSTQNQVSDNPLPNIDPLEKVLQVLEGILQALLQTKPTQGGQSGGQG
ncbi:MAG TPA: hypothetical protein VK539_26070 [Myxococcaceae bacterium]|nr:hypothetical protein [Myxococcaceae bacterium]